MLSNVDETDEMKQQTAKLFKVHARNMAIDHTLYHALFSHIFFFFLFLLFGVCQWHPTKAKEEEEVEKKI